MDALKVNVTETSIKKSEFIKGKNVIEILSDSLSSWNISTLPVKIGADELRDIPYPAVAQISKNNVDQFVVLQKIDKQIVHYTVAEEGLVKETLEQFINKWTGVTLLMEVNENSGEEGYKHKRKYELFMLISRYLTWILFTILLFISSLFLPESILPCYLFKIVGFIFCFLLLQRQYGNSGRFISAFCSLGSRSNCDRVINSPGSRLFGIVPLSELGLLYFAIGISTVIISGFSGVTASFTFAFSFILLPFTVIAVYYQWHIAKTWCPLCLAVMVIIWLEAISVTSFLSISSFSKFSMAISFVGFAMPTIFWLTVRHRLIESLHIPNLERSLSRFTYSDRIFQSLLAIQPTVDLEGFKNEIALGKIDAPIIITVISNPVCGPCAAAYAATEDLFSQFKDRIRINYRFSFNLSEPDSDQTKMVRHLIELALADPDHGVKALSAWYLKNGKRNIKNWMLDYPTPMLVDQVKVDRILSQHADWLKKAGIKTTPTIVINSKTYPKEYTVADLKFQIRKMLESIPDRELAQVS